MNNIDIELVFDYFKNVLDVPDYYCFHFRADDFLSYDKYASINNIDITLISNLNFNPSVKVNDVVRISDGKVIYDLLIVFDDYVMLLINDVIKSLGGELYEKNAL